jgi:hypothetical protein
MSRGRGCGRGRRGEGAGRAQGGGGDGAVPPHCRSRSAGGRCNTSTSCAYKWMGGRMHDVICYEAACRAYPAHSFSERRDTCCNRVGGRGVDVCTRAQTSRPPGGMCGSPQRPHMTCRHAHVRSSLRAHFWRWLPLAPRHLTTAAARCSAFARPQAPARLPLGARGGASDRGRFELPLLRAPNAYGPHRPIAVGCRS